MSTPIKENYIIVKRVFKYFYVKKYYVIFYQGKLVGENGKLNVHGFFDVNWVGDLDRWRFNNCYVFKMFDGAKKWMSK